MKLISFVFLIFISMMSSAFSQTDTSLVSFLQAYTAEHYSEKEFSKWLYISVGSQEMYLIENWNIQKKYIVSCGKTGIGNISGSNQTPVGLHSIGEKYGDGLELGAVLSSRKFTGKIVKIHTDSVDIPRDYVTTRLLWLRGEEQDINKGRNAQGQLVDSHKRYIYIHGTAEEGLLGTPASHGCIRMKNTEVVELYDQIESGALLLILE